MGLPTIVHALGFPIDFNGNLARIFGEAISVAKLGVDVEVVVSERLPPTENLKNSIENGVKIHYAKVLIRHHELGWRINNFLSLSLKTLEVIQRNSESILHIAAPSPVTRPLGVSMIGRWLKRPMVLDIIDVWAPNPFSLNPITVLQTGIMRRAINNADHIIVCHDPMAKLVKSINKDKKVTTIPNGVDTELFAPRQRDEALLKELGIEDRDTIIAFCGHITDVKGLDVLARAAKTVTQSCRNIVFLIIGDGPFLSDLKSLVAKLGVSNSFKFTGFVPSQVKYLSLADVCVAPYIPVPNLRFVHPMKTAEYMAMEKPVVISRIPSSEDVISNSGGGIQVSPGNVAELASSIITLIEDEKLRKTLGANGRKYVEENLGWPKIAKKLVKIYRSLAP